MKWISFDAGSPIVSRYLQHTKQNAYNEKGIYTAVGAWVGSFAGERERKKGKGENGGRRDTGCTQSPKP